MIQKIKNFLNKGKDKNQLRLHKQFQEVQKWQSEMYNFKTRQDLERIH